MYWQPLQTNEENPTAHHHQDGVFSHGTASHDTPNATPAENLLISKGIALFSLIPVPLLRIIIVIITAIVYNNNNQETDMAASPRSLYLMHSPNV